MTTQINPLAGKPAPLSTLIDVAKLVTAYFEIRPDCAIAAQRVVFGTSGHRGSSFDGSFNEGHVLAITQAICDYRQAHDISGPLFLGIDTHALSEPACASGLEVLAANGVNVMLATNDEYTPTPAISHAILTYNRGRSAGSADGIVITPSHNPPRDGGYKYNPPNGGPAEQEITDWIEAAANRPLPSMPRRRTATTICMLTSPISGPSSIWRRFAMPASESVSTPWGAPASTIGRRLPNTTNWISRWSAKSWMRDSPS
jgi:phosphoglucomutase